MTFLRWSLRPKWPPVDIYGKGRRGDIKTVSVSELERLQAAAAANPQWSAVGRPIWLREHKDRIRYVMLTVTEIEHPSVYRCMVNVILDNRSGGRFTLEVPFKDFNRLADVNPKMLVTLAHEYLLTLPFLDLDPDQAETWKRLESSNERG